MKRFNIFGFIKEKTTKSFVLDSGIERGDLLFKNVNDDNEVFIFFNINMMAHIHIVNGTYDGIEIHYSRYEK